MDNIRNMIEMLRGGIVPSERDPFEEAIEEKLPHKGESMVETYKRDEMRLRAARRSARRAVAR